MSDNRQTPRKPAQNQAFINFLDDVFATRTDEIQCDIAENLIAQCAAQGLTDEEAQQQYPGLFYHFQFCPDCQFVYETVVGYARDEAAGLVETPAYIPPVPKLEDAPGRAARWMEQAKGAVVRLLTPSPDALAMRGRLIGLESTPVTLSMEGDEVTISLKTEAESTSPPTRKLHCTVKTKNPDLKKQIASAPIWLEAEEAPDIVFEQSLSRFGDVTFTQVPPNTYVLHWRLGDQYYVIQDLEIT